MTDKKNNHVVYYPTFLNIQDKKCVVIGGGKVALRKIKILLTSGAKVAVISPEVHPELKQLAENGLIQLIQKEFEQGDLEDAVFVFETTDIKDINRKVVEESRRIGALVNVADDPALSDFILPSFFRRGGLTIAVSTSGKSPALARKIRTRLEQIFGEEYAILLSLIEEVRSELKLRGIGVSPEVWQEALNLDLLIDLLKTDQREKARAVLLGNLTGC